MDLGNLRTIFSDKAEDILLGIVKNNGLEETDDDFFDAISRGEEPKEMIVRGAVTALVVHNIPENKLTNLLKKHLNITGEKAQRIIDDIKKSVLPGVKVYPEEKFDDPAFREKITRESLGLEVVEKKETPIGIKKVELPDVEKNAQILKEKREETTKQGTIGHELQSRNQSDKYREGI